MCERRGSGSGRTGGIVETFIRHIQYQSRSDVFSLWFRGDRHHGNIGCDESAIRRERKLIADDPLALVFDLGDDGEFISPSDHRFRISELAPWILEEFADVQKGRISKARNRRVRETLSDLLVEHIVACDEPIKDKIMGKVLGNHCDKQARAYDHDVYHRVCETLGVRALEDEAVIRLIFQRGECGSSTTLTMYLHHGWFAGRTQGAKVNNLHRTLGEWDTDIVAVGHGHDRVMTVKITQRMNAAGQVVPWRRYGVMTGSYLRTRDEGVSTYASRAGFPSTDMGAVVLRFSPDKGTIVGEL